MLTGKGGFFCIDRGGKALVSSILLGIKPFYDIINYLIKGQFPRGELDRYGDC